MKTIFNNVIPFPGFVAVNICGLLFIRKKYREKVSKLSYQRTLINHESIHTEQMKELGYIGFYIAYLFEWVFRALFTKDAFSHQAYRNISFEKEAFENEYDLKYTATRKRYAMWRK